MATYIVSYDLINNKDYSSLTDKIKSYGTYAKILESLWAVSTEQSAKILANNLLSTMDNDDRIFVLKSGQEAAWKNALCTDKWLLDNL
ncbi:MAG: CRISPR-associated protein Cas2 [Candidatus Gracilibacteria bacterium]|nr:CRISPR-associated protein Cas2 [Candidatus Gracilibacteria bacterium]